jgi:hypothetical protein
MNHNLLIAIAVSAVLCGGCQGQAQDKVAVESPKPKVADIADLLEPIRQKHNVPAICAAVVNSDGIIAVGAVGVRRRGDTAPVTSDDLWHLGSDTKAMTAAVVARLVEQKKVRWTSTLAELFPEDYKRVLALTEAENVTSREAELAVLGVSHAEIGGYLLGLWGFEETVVLAVARHHEPDRVGAAEALAVTLTHAANALEHEIVVINEHYAPHPLRMEALVARSLASRLPVWREVCRNLLQGEDVE